MPKSRGPSLIKKLLQSLAGLSVHISPESHNLLFCKTNNTSDLNQYCLQCFPLLLAFSHKKTFQQLSTFFCNIIYSIRIKMVSIIRKRNTSSTININKDYTRQHSLVSDWFDPINPCIYSLQLTIHRLTMDIYTYKINHEMLLIPSSWKRL